MHWLHNQENCKQYATEKNNFIHFLQQTAQTQRSFMNHYADWMGFVTHAITISSQFIVMAALCNRAGHYIFALLFLSFFVFLLLSFFPRIISAAADWMSTILAHMVWP